MPNPSSQKLNRPTAEETRALENIARLVEYNRQDNGLDGATSPWHPVASVGIVGAGMMGCAIAAAEVRQGIAVVLTDTDRRALGSAPQRIGAELAAEMPEELAQETVDRLVRTSIAIGPVASCDLVIESIVESYLAKNKLYADVEPRMEPDAILTSNTSTIPVGRLACGMQDPSRFCGLHFCHPVRLRPLVEIVRGAKTADVTIATAVEHIKAIGRMPIVVHDGPGFLINRLLLPYVSESLDLLLEGATVGQIEQAAAEFGMSFGPLRLLDEIGLDTTLHGGMTLAGAFPDRIAPSPLLVGMIKEGRLGRKAGQGFFRYTADGAPTSTDPSQDDEFLQKLVAKWKRTPENHTKHSITMRLLLPMLLEGTRILDENKVRDPRDIDLAAVFGLGFPAVRGGLLWWADTLGPARIIEMLRPMAKLGVRTQPTPVLQKLARHAGRFYRD